MEMLSNRQAFEEWCEKKGYYHFKEDDNHTYRDRVVQLLWEAWNDGKWFGDKTSSQFKEVFKSGYFLGVDNANSAWDMGHDGDPKDGVEEEWSSFKETLTTRG
jgi:hypothetical protein